MATVAGNFYKITYQILTNGTLTDPPIVVGPMIQTTVNAASQTAAVAALLADLSLSGSQRLKVHCITQVEEHLQPAAAGAGAMYS